MPSESAWSGPNATEITALGQPVVDLPWLADGVDLAGLYELSDLLGQTQSEVPW